MGEFLLLTLILLAIASVSFFVSNAVYKKITSTGGKNAMVLSVIIFVSCMLVMLAAIWIFFFTFLFQR